MDLAPAGLSTGCCGSSELPEVSRAWLLAACICIASSSTCSSRDEEGKGSVSPGREVPIGRRAIKPVWPSVWHAPCLVEEVTLLFPALSSTQLPCNEGFLSFASLYQNLSVFSSVVPNSRQQQPVSPAVQKDKHPRAPWGAGSSQHRGDGRRHKMYFCLLSRSLFQRKKKRTKRKMFNRNTIKTKIR